MTGEGVRLGVHGIELFAGGGGMLLGSALIGVEHVAAVEWDRWACDTLEQSALNDYPLLRGMETIHSDVRDIDWLQYTDAGINLITGGHHATSEVGHGPPWPSVGRQTP